LSVREYLNKHPRVAFGIAVAGVLLGVGFAVWAMRGGEGISMSKADLPKRYFTTDDGKTFFPDTIDKIPPFTTSDNKTAYLARVLQCGKSQPYVAYLEKYGDADRKRLEGWFGDSKTRSLAIESVMGVQSTAEVKKPLTGDTGWVTPKGGAKYDAIIQQTCPDGGTPQPVLPKD
jgi:hypothetical protein